MKKDTFLLIGFGLMALYLIQQNQQPRYPMYPQVPPAPPRPKRPGTPRKQRAASTGRPGTITAPRRPVRAGGGSVVIAPAASPARLPQAPAGPGPPPPGRAAAPRARRGAIPFGAGALVVDIPAVAW